VPAGGRGRLRATPARAGPCTPDGGRCP
jgi:hypothetical protein